MQPNIIYIMLDDLGKEWISCYGATDIATPNIDRLADQGMRFQNVYSMPQCTPSRMCLFTGQYPYRNGWVNHWDVPRWGAGARYDTGAYPCNLGLMMRQAGYVTSACGKWQVNDFRVEPQAMDAAGFDTWCMWTGFEAHNPPSAERYWDPYIVTDTTPAQTYPGQFGPDIFCQHAIDVATQNANGDSPFFLYYAMVLPHAPFTTTPHDREAESDLDKHKAMVRYADHCIGRLITALDDLGIREQTLVVFTSDNGTAGSITGHIGDRSVRGGKSRTVEPGVNIPFVVSWPGTVPQGVVTEELCDFTDMIPTFADLAEQEVPGPNKVDGVSVAPFLRGECATIERDWILAMGGQNNAQVSQRGVENEWVFRDRVVRDKTYKLYVGADRRPAKFIDLNADPDEQYDLSNQLDQQAQQAMDKLSALIDTWPLQDADPRCVPQPPQEWDIPVSVESMRWKRR